MIKSDGSTVPAHGRCYNLNLGNVYAVRKDNRAALAAYERALGILVEGYGEGAPRVAAILDNIAAVQRELGDLDAALRNHREALEIRERVYPENHPEIATSHFGIGACLVNRGDVEAGIAELRAGLAVFEASVGPDHPDTAQAHAALGQALIDSGAAEEGEIHLARAWRLCEAREVGPGTRGEIAWIYAQRLAARGEVERARTLAEVARGDFEALGNRDKVAEIDAWRTTATEGVASE